MFSETFVRSLHGANLAKHRDVFARQRRPLYTSQISLCTAIALTCINCSNGLSGQTDLSTDSSDTLSADSDTTAQPDMSTALSQPSVMLPPPSNATPSIDAAQSSPDPSGVGTSSATKGVAAAPASGAMQAPRIEAEAFDNTSAAAAPPAPADDWAASCDQLQTFRAHGAQTAGDASPYSVAAGTEETRRFYFKTPREVPLHLLKSRAVSGNARVVHHWALYVFNDALLPDGAILSGNDLFDVLRVSEMRFLVGGGPGSSEFALPPGVGLRLPQGANVGYVFEVHYFNATNQAEEDASGVDLCVTSKPVEHEAAAHLLGRVTFQVPARGPSDVTSTCEPVGFSEPLHIVAVTPHMHESATHAKIVLNRSTDEKTIVVDQPFNVSEQHTYPVAGGAETSDLVMNPGDTVTTTCSYVNTGDRLIESGTKADNEMCLMLVWAWPAGALHNDLELGKKFGVDEDLDCMDE